VLVLLPALLALTPVCFAKNFYVSIDGNDANPGTLALPWRSIQKAADSLAPGDTAHVRGGTYRETVSLKVSGRSGLPITLRNYRNERVVVDASGKVPGIERSGVFRILGRSHIVLRGFEMRNYTTNLRGRVPAGVWVEGACRGITVQGCKISNIANTAIGGNAFGIIVYGTSAVRSAGDISIVGNEKPSGTGWREHGPSAYQDHRRQPLSSRMAPEVQGRLPRGIFGLHSPL